METKHTKKNNEISLLKPSLLRLFLVFLKIGALTFGGGLSMIPILERELTGKSWMSKEEFAEMLTITNLAPGPFAINSSTYIGFKLRGIPGAIFSVIGNALVPIVLILLIVGLLLGKINQEWIDKFFNGARPAVVALILGAGVHFSKGINKKPIYWLLGIVALLGILFLKINPIFFILAGALAGIAIGIYQEKQARRKDGGL